MCGVVNQVKIVRRDELIVGPNIPTGIIRPWGRMRLY